MAIAQFKDTNEIGKVAEARAEKYFKKHNIEYQDVRDNPEYRKIDVDYVTDIGSFEIKSNYHTALKYHPGQFFWIEISIDEKDGWWKFCKSDYFMFFGDKGAIIIKNDEVFKTFINNLIENGNREINRFDYKPDYRYQKIVYAKSMRVYLSQLEDTEVNITKIVTRRKVA